MGGSSTNMTPMTGWLPGPSVAICVALLLRSMVGLWPYSGQGERPMYGDYEAQRHWMEITTAFPLHLWYRFDLEYWGLDYPPLTAYVSWACGQVSSLVEPASMALGLSRGFETPSHKAFMRLTVLLLDFTIFFPAAAGLTTRLARSSPRRTGLPRRSWESVATSSFILVLLQPSLVLIDHGHFQYNSVCLGLAMAAAWALMSRNHRGELLGSFLFSLSLNFKQMALYYAPAFFFFLLASCISSGGADGQGGGPVGCKSLTPRWTGVFRRVIQLGLVVLLTFGALWAPFCLLPGGGGDDADADADATGDAGGCLASVGQVALRLFPFSRGLFEDKVANLWFCADVVLKLRRRMAVPVLAKLALLSTLGSLVPVGAELLRPGRALTARRLMLALFNSSMAFFLCSFQVHEKSLLLPLCPIAFLWGDAPLFTTWVQVIGMFSMTPLLSREGLMVPCLVCTMLYVGASVVFAKALPPPCGEVICETSAFPYGRYLTRKSLRAMVALSLGGVLILLALEAMIPPPDRLPFLHPTLNAVYSCGNLVAAYVIGVCWQWQEGERGQVGVVGTGSGGDSTGARDTKKGR